MKEWFLIGSRGSNEEGGEVEEVREGVPKEVGIVEGREIKRRGLVEGEIEDVYMRQNMPSDLR